MALQYFESPDSNKHSDHNGDAFPRIADHSLDTEDDTVFIGNIDLGQPEDGFYNSDTLKDAILHDAKAVANRIRRFLGV